MTSAHHLAQCSEYCLKSLLLIHTLQSSRSTCLQKNMCLNNIWYLVSAFLNNKHTDMGCYYQKCHHLLKQQSFVCFKCQSLKAVKSPEYRFEALLPLSSNMVVKIK